VQDRPEMRSLHDSGEKETHGKPAAGSRPGSAALR
jgi:hypothetical protein